MRGMARGYAAGNSRGPGWHEFAGKLGQLQAGSQAGSGMARSRAMARVNWVSQGQCWGRCRVRRRAERVIRPTRAKTRRLRVLVVTVRSARPMRAVQRARLCHHLHRQPGAVGGEAPRGEMVESDAVFQVSNGVLDLGVAAMIGLQFQGFPVPVGDEAVIAVGGEEGQLGTGRGLHPPDDEPHRRGAGFTLEGGIGPHFPYQACWACRNQQQNCPM